MLTQLFSWLEILVSSPSRGSNSISVITCAENMNTTQIRCSHEYFEFSIHCLDCVFNSCCTHTRRSDGENKRFLGTCFRNFNWDTLSKHEQYATLLLFWPAALQNRPSDRPRTSFLCREDDNEGEVPSTRYHLTTSLKIYRYQYCGKYYLVKYRVNMFR